MSAVASGGLSELQWAKIRLCIESMSRGELQGCIKDGTIGKVLDRAVYPRRRYAHNLRASIVDEALRLWSHLAKE
ncbi:MAG: hypothetical protein LLG00_14895 [Planctomycetaceae bacterium]|nr:hypothetical protein [Planctomycetaceae bacterium]